MTNIFRTEGVVKTKELITKRSLLHYHLLQLSIIYIYHIMLPVAATLLLLDLDLEQSIEKEDGEEGRRLSEVGRDGRILKTNKLTIVDDDGCQQQGLDNSEEGWWQWLQHTRIHKS